MTTVDWLRPTSWQRLTVIYNDSLSNNNWQIDDDNDSLFQADWQIGELTSQLRSSWTNELTELLSFSRGNDRIVYQRGIFGQLDRQKQRIMSWPRHWVKRLCSETTATRVTHVVEIDDKSNEQIEADQPQIKLNPLSSQVSCNLSNCRNEAWKKIRLGWDSNPGVPNAG